MAGSMAALAGSMAGSLAVELVAVQLVVEVAADNLLNQDSLAAAPPEVEPDPSSCCCCCCCWRLQLAESPAMARGKSCSATFEVAYSKSPAV